MEFFERGTEIKSAIGDVSTYNNGCVLELVVEWAACL